MAPQAEKMTVEQVLEFLREHGNESAKTMLKRHGAREPFFGTRIADMKLRLETARLLTYKVAWLKSVGQSVMLDAAIAKLYLSECYVESSLDAIRVYGGYGYMTEYEVERDLRDAIGGTLYGGTSDIQRNIIARFMGL